MAVVQFPVKTKYDGVWQPPHTPFKVRNADVPELISSGAVVLAGPEEDADVVPEVTETEEEKQARLIAEAQAEEERLAAEENSEDVIPEEEKPAEEPKKPSRANKEK